METKFDNIIKANIPNKQAQARAAVGVLAIVGLVATTVVATRFVIKTASMMIDTDNSINRLAAQLKKQKRELDKWFHPLYNAEVDTKTEINKKINEVNNEPVKKAEPVTSEMEQPVAEEQPANEEQPAKSDEDKNDWF